MDPLPEDTTVAQLFAMAKRLNCELEIHLEPIPKTKVTATYLAPKKARKTPKK